MQKARPEAAEGSGGKDDLWQKLWKVDCPPKIRHFSVATRTQYAGAEEDLTAMGHEN